jgi:dethiobiotin synthase
MARNSYFITGTDTGIGKTVIAAAVALKLGATYWKPVQTGTLTDDDTDTVARLTGVAVATPRFRLPEPLSPHAAAALAGVKIALPDLLPPPDARPLVVEGAGGVLVPLNDTDLMIDLIAALGFPAVVVARSTLGTINHTLLTLAALRARAVPVAGVILNGPRNPGNRQAIEAYGRVRILAEVVPQPLLDAAAVRGIAHDILLEG